MESTSLPIRIKRFFSNFTNKIIKNKSYFIIITLIVVLAVLAYYLSYNYVVGEKMNELDDKYVTDVSFQTDYCSPSLKNRRVVDYHIKSSFSTASTGLQRYDYLSLEMIKNVIYLGTRYVEFEIFSDTQKNDSFPVISSGYKKGDWKLTQNTLNCEEVFKVLKDFAFSDRFITNSNDPLFIFLDLKTKNTKVLDKLADILSSYFTHRLLTDVEMSKCNNNIAIATMCDLMNKVVIMASDNPSDSKLSKIINISIGPNLSRLKYSQVIFHKKYNDAKPDSYLKSNKISFHSGLSYDYIEVSDPNVNFQKGGFKPDMMLEIGNAKFSENNTGKHLLTIDDVTKNKIAINKKDVFKSDTYGNEVILKGFIPFIDTNNIEEDNKNKLTILIPDKGLFDRNFNPKNAWYSGSQFVCMRYQHPDDYMKTYLHFFSKRCIKLKQDSLLNKLDNDVHDESSDIIMKEPTKNKIYDIDSEFLNNNLNLIIFMEPYFNNNFKLTCNEANKLNISLSFDDDDYKFEFFKSPIKSLDNAVMIKYGNQYLVTNDEDNYLRFEEKPKNSESFIKKASFLLLKSTMQNKYNSLGHIKDKIDKNGNPYKALYYLKYNTSFSPKSKIYKKKQTKYKKIRTLTYTTTKNVNNTESVNTTTRNVNTTESANTTTRNDNTTESANTTTRNDNTTESANTITYTIWRPLSIDGFYPIGDVIFEGTNLPMDSSSEGISSIIVKGAISKPIGYDMVYQNNEELDKPDMKLYTIWKPKAPDGYIAMGVVVSDGNNQPTTDTVVCIRADLLKEAEFQSNVSNISLNDYTMYKSTFYNKNISLWTGSSNKLNYFIAYPTTIVGYSKSTMRDKLEKPNEFDYPLYDFVDQSNMTDDLLYLDDQLDLGDKESTVFKIIVNNLEGEFTSYQTYDDINFVKDMDNKVNSYTNNRIGGDMCMALPNPYWTNIYTNNDEDSSVNKKYDDKLLYLNKHTEGNTSSNNFPVLTNEKMCSQIGGIMPQEELWKSDEDGGRCYFGLSNTRKDGDNVFINKSNSCMGSSKVGSAGINVSFKDCMNMNGTYEGDKPDDYNKTVNCKFDLCSSMNDQSLLLGTNNINDSHLNSATMYFEDKLNTENYEDTCNTINGYVDGMECKKNVYYTRDKSQLPLKTEGCRDSSYIGTNWYRDVDDSIHLKYNPDYCVSAQLDDQNNNYNNALPSNTAGKDNKLVLEKCKSGRIGQQFKYVDNTLKYVSPNTGITNYCITNNRDDTIRLEECNNNPNQNWNSDQMPLDYMITEGSIIYYYHREKRHAKESSPMVFNTPVPNLLEEKYDDKYFHMYVRCRVMAINNNNIQIKYFHNSEIVELPIKTSMDKIVLEYPALTQKLDKQPGAKVLVQNGAFIGQNIKISEENVRWYGVVTKKVSDTNYQVFITINSIEPNQNNLRMNRPDHPQVKSVNIEHLILFKEPLIRM